MKKMMMLCFAIATLSLICNCKSPEEKRAECLEAANSIVAEWYNQNVFGETAVFLNNYFSLIEKYGKLSFYKEYNHIEGMKSDSAGFEQQRNKDSSWLNEVKEQDRYRESSSYELDKTRVWYADDVEEKLSSQELRAKQFCNKLSLVAYITSKEELFEDMDSASYGNMLKEYLPCALHQIDWIRKLEYLAFVHTEYVYPPLVTNGGIFEPGFQCSRLQIFRIADKECVFDNRIFAVNRARKKSPRAIQQSDYQKMKEEMKRYGYVLNNPILERDVIFSELSDRTKDEVVLQCVKQGLSYIDTSK